MTKTQTLPNQRTSPWTCPVCGRPFTAVDMVMYEHEENYQCRYCWSQLKNSGASNSPIRTNVPRVKLSRS